MPRPDDIVLMAYADGVLAGVERREVERALRADPDLRRQLGEMRRAAVLARLAFEEPMWSEPPRALLDTINRREPGRRGWPRMIEAVTGWCNGQWRAVALASLAAYSIGFAGGIWLAQYDSEQVEVAPHEALPPHRLSGSLRHPNDIAVRMARWPDEPKRYHLSDDAICNNPSNTTRA